MRFKDINFNTHSKNLTSWFLYSAIIIIALIYSWYFFIHVNSNENKLIAKSFRVLTQTGHNIIQKDIDLKEIVRNVEKKIKNTPTVYKEKEQQIFFEGNESNGINDSASLDLFKNVLEMENSLLRVVEGDKCPDDEKNIFLFIIIFLTFNCFFTVFVIILNCWQYRNVLPGLANRYYQLDENCLVGEISFTK